MLKIINPANGNIIRTYEEHSAVEVADRVNAAYQAFLAWRETTFPQRVETLRNAARILTDQKEEYTALMATEMGKPIRDGRAEIEKCAWVCDFYADNDLTALQPESIETDARKSCISFNPIGVILAVMPWNYPFWQVFRFAAPAMMKKPSDRLLQSLSSEMRPKRSRRPATRPSDWGLLFLQPTLSTGNGLLQINWKLVIAL